MTRVVRPESESPRLDEVVAMVERHAFLFPTWCHEILVQAGHHTDPDGAETRAISCSVACSVRYRFANIFIHAAFWTDSEDAREESIRHEVVHILLAPLDDSCKQMLDEFVLTSEREEKFKSYLRERYKDAMEQTVVDVTRAMGQHDNPRWTRRITHIPDSTPKR